MTVIQDNAISEKLKAFFSEKGLSQQDIADRFGVSQPAVSALLNGKPFGKNQAKKWGDEFGIKPNWLLTGEGEMLKSDVAPPAVINYEKRGVPYYNVDFIGGFEVVENDQTINPEYYIDFKPYNNAELWINITGHSMDSKISHGDFVALREVRNWFEFLPFGEIYAIVTDEFRTVKTVTQGSRDDLLLLIPFNHESQYRSQEIPKKLIRKVFQVLGSVKRF